jgi:polyhydroxyalkanoate synthase subunit PhaC
VTSESSARPTADTETTISADNDRPVPAAAATRPATSRGAGIGEDAAPRRSRRPEPAAAPAGPTTTVGHTETAAPLDLLLTDGAVGPLRRLAPAGPGLRWAADLAGRPTTIVRRLRDLSAELGQVAIGRSTGAAGERDRRFRDDAWRTNPILRRILQAYLATSGTAEALLADAHLDWRDRTRLQFALDNLVAALAPSNHPLISPTAWKALIDSGGANVVQGVRNLVTDLVEAPRVPTMVRPDAFEVGVDLAVTPGAVVLRTETFELIQYTPQTPTVRTRPLLIVPPVINKYYLADLAPGRSLVEYLVRGGQQVFMISWRNPDVRHRGWNIDTYGQAILDALDAALAVADADAATVLGFCSGGTLQSMALAALQQRGQLNPKVGSFALAVCVLDQAEAGMAAASLDDTTARAAATASATRGYLDGRTLAEVFAWLRPNDLIWNYWVNNYLQGNDPPPFDILFWNADTTRMTAALHRDFLDLALRNALGAPGQESILGEPVDLAAITIDGYVVAGVADHISPWQACYRSAQLFGGQTRFVLSTSGHVAAIVNPPTNAKATHQVSADLGAEAAGWQRGTAMTQGSWWPDYLAWLSQRSGPDRDAPKALGGAGLMPLDAAPGVYVLDR